MTRKTPPAPLVAPSHPPARYSSRPLPPYRHVPGLTPHPVKDPAGHLFGSDEPEPAPGCQDVPLQWLECSDYLYGVDLFNRAYLWEAHEAWEVVWIAAGKTGETARFVQGLIQVSAALLRQHLGTPRGAQNLLRKSRRHLWAIEARLAPADRGRYMGVAIRAWFLEVEDHLTDPARPYPFLRLDPGSAG